MSYYGAGDYYMAGDYYGAGGLFSAIGGALKKVGGAALRGAVGFVTGGPVGAATAVAAPILRSSPTGGGPLIAPTTINPPFAGPPGMGVGPIGTPAHMATINDRRFYTKDGRPRRIRRDGRPYGIPSMDPGNTKALRRAARRMDRFVGVARSALKHTKYGVYTRSSRTSRRKK